MKKGLKNEFFWARLVYDSRQINLFSRGKMWKCFDSVTMNRYNSNIPINSIMCLSTYESSQSRLKNGSNDSVKSINQLIIYICCRLGKHDISLTFFLENVWFHWLFWDILNLFNWFNHTSPSKSIDSVTHFMKRNDSVTNHLTWKRNWIN